MISVLLVEDQALLVELLRRWLTRDPAIHVVGAVSELRALATIPARRVDVVLMDYVLPDGTGVDGIRAVKHRWPGARVVMLTTWDDETVMLDAVQAGADGFLSKDVPPDEVLRAVHVAHAGGVLIPTAVLARLAGSLRGHGSLARTRHELRRVTFSRPCWTARAVAPLGTALLFLAGSYVVYYWLTIAGLLVTLGTAIG